MEHAYSELKRIIDSICPCLVAFSGVSTAPSFSRWPAIDSATVVTGDDHRVSPSLPAAEREEAVTLARMMGANPPLVETHEMDDPAYLRNDGARCYYCKRELFGVLRRIAAESRRQPNRYARSGRPGRRTGPGCAQRRRQVSGPLSSKPADQDDDPGAVARARAADMGQAGDGLPGVAHPPHDSRDRRGPVPGGARRAALHALGYRQVRVRHQGLGARIELDADGLRRSCVPEDRELLIAAVRRAGTSRSSSIPAATGRPDQSRSLSGIGMAIPIPGQAPNRPGASPAERLPGFSIEEIRTPFCASRSSVSSCHLERSARSSLRVRAELGSLGKVLLSKGSAWVSYSSSAGRGLMKQLI